MDSLRQSVVAENRAEFEAREQKLEEAYAHELEKLSSNLHNKKYKDIMYLSKITVRNFRLLKNFSIDLEQDLSLVIGKNNSGKTSLLYLLDKVLHWREKGGSIHIDDFNLDFKNLWLKC